MFRVQPQFILSNKCVHINSGRRRSWKIIAASYYDLIYSPAWPQLLNFRDTYEGFGKWLEHFPIATVGALHDPCGWTTSAGPDWNLSAFKGWVKFCGASLVRCGTCTSKEAAQIAEEKRWFRWKTLWWSFHSVFLKTHYFPNEAPIFKRVSD